MTNETQTNKAKREIFSRRTRDKFRGNLIKYTKSLALGRTFPTWAYLFVTRDCNLNCTYCHVNRKACEKIGMPGASTEMSSDELKEAIDKLHSLGTRYISFFGGEPTLRRKELIEAIEHASKKRNMFTQLPTNGTTLLQPGYIEQLGEAQLDMVDVSLDSLARFDKSRKDMTRSGPLFDALFSGREKYGFAVKTNQVLTQKNKDQLEGMLDFADKNRILLSVRLAMPSPIPLPLPEQEGIYFTPKNEQDIRAVDRIVDTILERKGKGGVTSETPDFYKTMKRWIRGEKNLWKCDAGSFHLTINNDGRVMPCELLSSSYGIHFRELTKDYAKRFEQQTKDILAKCQDNCLAAAYFCGSDYLRHPWKLFTQGFLRLTG